MTSKKQVNGNDQKTPKKDQKTPKGQEKTPKGQKTPTPKTPDANKSLTNVSFYYVFVVYFILKLIKLFLGSN